MTRDATILGKKPTIKSRPPTNGASAVARLTVNDDIMYTCVLRLMCPNGVLQFSYDGADAQPENTGLKTLLSSCWRCTGKIPQHSRLALGCHFDRTVHVLSAAASTATFICLTNWLSGLYWA